MNVVPMIKTAAVASTPFLKDVGKAAATGAAQAAIFVTAVASFTLVTRVGFKAVDATDRSVTRWLNNRREAVANFIKPAAQPTPAAPQPRPAPKSEPVPPMANGHAEMFAEAA